MLRMRGSLLLAAPLAFCLTLFAACSALPTLVPDMEHSHSPVSLDGSRRPLEAYGAPPHIFDLHLAIEESILGSPLMAGNRVELLQNGPSTYQAMLEVIAGARDHIHGKLHIR